MVPKIHIVRTPDGLDFPLPSYSSKYHVGLNLLAGIPSVLKLNPGERAVIPTGFAIALPHGLSGQIVSLPELARKSGVIVLDAPSILNPVDRTQIMVLLQNTGQHQFILKRGMPIAWLVISSVIQVAWQEVAREKNGVKSGEPVAEKSFLSNAAPSIEGENQKKNIKRVRKSIRDRYTKDEQG